MGNYYSTRSPSAFPSGPSQSFEDFLKSRIEEKGLIRKSEAILGDFQRRLSTIYHLDLSSVRPTLNDGVIVIDGTVENSRIKKLVGDIAENIMGVKEVVNNLETKDTRQSGKT